MVRFSVVFLGALCILSVGAARDRRGIYDFIEKQVSRSGVEISTAVQNAMQKITDFVIGSIDERLHHRSRRSPSMQTNDIGDTAVFLTRQILLKNKWNVMKVLDSQDVGMGTSVKDVYIKGLETLERRGDLKIDLTKGKEGKFRFTGAVGFPGISAECTAVVPAAGKQAVTVTIGENQIALATEGKIDIAKNTVYFDKLDVTIEKLKDVKIDVKKHGIISKVLSTLVGWFEKTIHNSLQNSVKTFLKGWLAQNQYKLVIGGQTV